jgi:G:T/U-mismatch repair DNA glycosylase
MFIHKHPYKPFIKDDTTKLIVGTLPPPRFSTGELLERDVDFCYGSYYNSLWLYIDRIHNLNLRFDNSETAVLQRKDFLIQHKIGVCDIVECAERDKIDASDLGMKHIKLRDVVSYLQVYPKIDTILFMGGNSKNGPEYFFRKHLKSYNLRLNLVSNSIPRIHEFELDGAKNPIRTIKTVSLTSPSGSANRAIGSIPLYKKLKAANANFSPFDFRVMQYRAYF